MTPTVNGTCVFADLAGFTALTEAHGDAYDGADSARHAIDEAAIRLRGARAMVAIGSRGRRELASLVLGSVSHHVVHHAGRPTLVGPTPALASRRRASGAPAIAA